MSTGAGVLARQRDPGSSLLLTDLYELTMLQTYFEHGMTGLAVFELFFRRPAHEARNFLVAAGLEQALEYLEDLHADEAELEWMAATGRFSRAFISRLRDLRFTGDVHALPEGTLVFPDEPVIRITAPLPEAQLVESRLMNILHFQTLIASKAARSVLQAPGRQLVDFGMRRAHAAEAALYAARAAYLAGFSGSSTALAGQRYGVPVFGTMAHSFVQAHDSESLAFERFARSHPGGITLLIDTYDTEAAARKLAALAPGLAADGIRIAAVRLDSGDLADHAIRVRRILDDAGLREVRIFASSGLDEFKLQELLEVRGAPIDGFGIGSALDTSQDLPTLDCAYKLQEYAGLPRRKRSEGKATWPGRKQVFRRRSAAGDLAGDTLALEHERIEGEPLLRPVMRGGRRLPGLPDLPQAREHCRAQLAQLPVALRALVPAPPYPVAVSEALRALAAEADRRQMEALP